MKVLVTGGTGVVGAAVIPALLRAGHDVRLLSRHAERDVRTFPEGVESYQADVSDPASLPSAVADCDAILHIAGIVQEDPPEATFDRVNVNGTRELLRAAAETGTSPFFIYLSSLGADRGRSEYHQSKLRAEELVRGYSGPWLIVRPGGVYGPGDETVSTLLKMVRTLPAVPVVSQGEQPFQPIWYADLGEMLARAVSRPDHSGQTLEVAGPEITTTDAILEKLAQVTGRRVPKLSVPVWVTEVGIQALEAFGAAGRKMLQRAGIEAPLAPAQLDMLVEENVIRSNSRNALTEFVPEPTSLDDGLAMLADMLPEQLPGDGVGAIQESTYWAEIVDAKLTPKELLDRVCERINEVMPIEFAAEPGAPRSAEPGQTLTGAITGRGNIQVKLEERTDLRATFVTLEGHPLAGVMQLHVEQLTDRMRFNVHLAAQPANVLDWLAMKTVGGPMQQANWREVVRRVVALSGGRAPGGVQHESHPMDEREAGDIRNFAERLVRRQQRAERTAQVEAKS